MAGSEMRARDFANSKLVVFDIDDTLVNTNTLVNVVRDGRVVKQLNSHDFTHYHLQPGEEFDFGRFRDAREFYTNARPIAPMINRLKQDIATGNRVIMLTARADFNDRDVFLDTFRQYGIDMDRVHVYRAGNLQTRAATEEKKKIILNHLLGQQHYDKVIMYDDSVPNLNAFLSLSQDYPWSRFYAWHVDPRGRATEYHRTGDSLKNRLQKDIDENFADGRKPGRKGLSRRVGIPRKATLGQLEKIAQNSTGERRRMAQWQLNMRRGKSRKK
jgi:hypothetical protein